MTYTISAKPANFTRQSTSFVGKFAREGRYHLIPLYWLLRQSDLAREGIERSGSYRFADHLYEGVPSGHGWLGRRLDALLLNLPASRAMRQRCSESRDAMRTAFESFQRNGSSEPFRILTVPCGLPRDVRDFAEQLHREQPSGLRQVEYTGIDIDAEVIADARSFLAGSAIEQPVLKIGNALDPKRYPVPKPHFIASTGLGEFLDELSLQHLYENIFNALAPGGVFFTSATACEPRSDAMLRAFELQTHYRTGDQVKAILQRFPWRSIEVSRDRTGLQSFITATTA